MKGVLKAEFYPCLNKQCGKWM